MKEGKLLSASNDFLTYLSFGAEIEKIMDGLPKPNRDDLKADMPKPKAVQLDTKGKTEAQKVAATRIKQEVIKLLKEDQLPDAEQKWENYLALAKNVKVIMQDLSQQLGGNTSPGNL